MLDKYGRVCCDSCGKVLKEQCDYHERETYAYGVLCAECDD